MREKPYGHALADWLDRQRVMQDRWYHQRVMQDRCYHLVVGQL